MPKSGLADTLRVTRYTLPLLLSAALIGCQSSASEGGPQGERPQHPTYERSDYTIPCLEVALDAPDEVKVGTGVTFAVSATNTCEEPLKLEHIPTPQRFFVLDGDQIVWDSWPAGAEPSAVAYELTLGPGESASWEFPSPDFGKAPFSGISDDGTALAEGAYTVVGRLINVHPALEEGATQGPPIVPGLDTELQPIKIVR